MKLSYITSGHQIKGTIVALHGVTDNAASLADIATHYGHEWRVILVDTLGHGLSDNFSDLELEDPFKAACDAVAAVIQKIAETSLGGKVILMGHSMGGAIAAKIAVTHEHLLDAVILEDPALLTEELDKMYRDDAPNLVEGQEKVRELVGEAIIDLQSTYKNWSPQEYAGWAQGKTQVDLRFAATGVVGTTDSSLLSDIQIPTLLLTGDSDDVLFDDERLASISNKNIDSQVIKDATHTIRRDQSASFYETVDNFLASLNLQNNRKEPFIRAEMAEVIASTPPQDTWNIEKIRERTEEKTSTVPDAFDISFSSLDTLTLRIIGTNPNPHTVVISLHGGGFVAGHPSFDDETNRALAHDYDAIVVSPDYRLAPEHPYPKAVEDAHKTLTHCATHYPNSQLIIFGDSAGASIGASLFSRDIPTEVHSRIKCFIALEPCIDPNMTSTSWDLYRDGPIWDYKAATHAWKHYLSDENTEKYRLPDPTNLPPTLVIVNPVDPLRDEGIQWAKSLADSGVQSELYMTSGTIHGGLTTPDSAIWKKNRALISNFISNLHT